MFDTSDSLHTICARLNNHNPFNASLKNESGEWSMKSFNYAVRHWDTFK